MSHSRILSITMSWTVACVGLLLLFVGQTTAAPLSASKKLSPLMTAAFTESQQIEIGAFAGVNPPTSAAVNAFEDLADRHISSVMWFQGWDASNQPSFPCDQLLPVLNHDGFPTGISFHLTWEPWVMLADIANGAYDAYLARYAAQIKKCGLKTRLRFAHEMIQNDNYDNCQNQAGCPEWYPWQDQPTDYVTAFRHVHDAFRTAGASNVEFVWCPNNYPFDPNIVQKYYPGQAYVDWLCTDGYNRTNSDGQPGYPDWQWFDDLFYPIYHTFADHSDIFGTKPVMIGEFASCEASAYELPGQTKAAWINNAFERMRGSDYDRIQSFYWFHINKECDWRVNSSPQSLAAFRTAMQDSHFTSHRITFFYLPFLIKIR